MTRSGRRRAGRSLALPAWWVAALVVVLVVVVGVVAVVVRHQVSPCRDELVDAPRNPLLSPAGMREQPDPRLDTLAAAVTAMDAPFGEVVAGVGYDYDQWLRVFGIEAGVLAFTKNNAPVTLLDADSLQPRWSLRPGTKRIAWDAAGDRFLLLDLSAKDPTPVSAYDATDGRRVWCAELPQRQASGDPVATAFLDDGDVLVALPDGDRIALSRLAAASGKTRWTREYSTVGRADYLGPLDDSLVVAGGTEEFRLGEPTVDAKAASVITALGADDGRPAWTWDTAAGTVAHVVGVDSGHVVAVERGPGGVRLFALSGTGAQLWSVAPQDAAVESTLRDGVVLMKSASALFGYDASTGRQLWTTPVPTDRTYFPYGFTLGQMPSLDDSHVLMPTTTALVVLDVHDGSQVAHPLPVDGISTTYWPYQLLATPDLLGVVTNTGAILARRE